MKIFHLRIGSGVGKQGYGNRTPINDRKPIRKFSIDPLCLQNQWGNSASTDSPWQRIKADTEIQYQPRIIDMDIDCGPRCCGLLCMWVPINSGNRSGNGSENCGFRAHVLLKLRDAIPRMEFRVRIITFKDSPLFPEREFAVFRYQKCPYFSGKSSY